MQSIHKISEVDQLTVTASPSRKDTFSAPLVQTEPLPHTFLAGEEPVLKYDCLNCGQPIIHSVGYGAFLLARTWSLKKVNHQRELLNEVGQLLLLQLRSVIEQEQEVTRYYNAVLDIATVGYLRCPHCQAQYLMGFSQRLTDNEGRGKPEPDTIHVQSIAFVNLNEHEFISALESTIKSS
ncbi:hypothetical protein [Hymenobacter weizhouensis]|uniref:hypothetical protein n=1 Tax=Hymenobacter sp. YIM 151500-1 TaxID=2987689 RepID=UPI002227C701|nr:hypothetical protein [Hymenobacter sp. YIM 151500-1]UYZ64402.1 hypothetical protein OIS53_06005 [Hymenobacter sp. YIM 151500-1]